MSLHNGFTPKMKPVSPRRSAIVAALDIGTSKIVCLIARLKPQSPQDVLRRRSHGIGHLGSPYRGRGIKAARGHLRRPRRYPGVGIAESGPRCS
jgi:cell division protein FtsA